MVDENLCFMDDVMSPADVHHHPAILEMIDFLRTNHYSESKSEESVSRFEKAAEQFRAMFNGNSDMGLPCHRCTHSCFPLQLRHCQHRQDAVRKCVDALSNLFLSSMPSIPAPNKWTTLYPSLVTESAFQYILVSRFRSCFLQVLFVEFQFLQIVSVINDLT